MSIQSEIDRLKNVKTAIKYAIVEKGVAVPEGTTFREYATKILDIPTGSVDGWEYTTQKISDVKDYTVWMDETGTFFGAFAYKALAFPMQFKDRVFQNPYELLEACGGTNNIMVSSDSLNSLLVSKGNVTWYRVSIFNEFGSYIPDFTLYIFARFK